MPSYKLYYFASRGRAEAIRLLFHLADQPFEDVRVTPDQWPSLKEEMPLGQMPVLEVDGQKIGQSTTIIRFLAHQFGLAGSNPLEMAKLDMIVEHVQDLSNDAGVAVWWQTQLGIHPDKHFNTSEGKKEYFKTKVLPAIEQFSPVIEKFLLENGNNGLFSGDNETWADVFAAEQYAKFRDFGEPNCLEVYPHIKALVERIHSHPRIRKYIESRPATSA